MILYLYKAARSWYPWVTLDILTKVVVTSTILPESIILSCLPAYIEIYGNHNTINSTHEHVQPSLINKHRVSYILTTLECNYYCCIYLYCIFRILIYFLDLTWYFCNHVVLMKLFCMWNSVPSKPNGDLFIACHTEFGLP